MLFGIAHESSPNPIRIDLLLELVIANMITIVGIVPLGVLRLDRAFSQLPGP